MDRALNPQLLVSALGDLPNLPSPEELRDLLAETEIQLFRGTPKVRRRLARMGWILHAVGSAGEGRYELQQRQHAFRISAHILELVARHSERPNTERIQAAFGSQIGYRRSGLDPNATAVFRAVESQLVPATPRGWPPDTALEAGVRFLAFRPRDFFDWARERRAVFQTIRRDAHLQSLASTIFGPSDHILEGCMGLMRFLVFGDEAGLESGRARLRAALAEVEPATSIERWVAAQLFLQSDELEASSVWRALPPQVSPSVRRALTSTNPVVLTLWEPQRELLGADVQPNPLAPETRRCVLSIPTSAGKTLVAQILVLAELARTGQSVCLVAPQRSLVREIRKTLFPRVRALNRTLGLELPDWAAPLLEDIEPPDVEILTPERFARALRTDPEMLLARFGLFIFDEAHLVGDLGRGFTLEGAVSYLHWKTRETDHRIILMSAAIGNEAVLQTWIDPSAGGTSFRSDWRGPRRLLAAFTGQLDFNSPTRVPQARRNGPSWLEYPVTGEIAFAVPGRARGLQLRTTEPIGKRVFRADSEWRRGKYNASKSSPHYRLVAGIVEHIGQFGPVLTVVSTRADAQRMAGAIAEDATHDAGSDLPDEIAAMLDPEHPLVAAVSAGVAYHHAGLPGDVLALVEDEFRAGTLRHLVCTTTLTEGVNLPVHAVVLAETKWSGSALGISGPRVLNALGRAGRAGIETEGWVLFAPSGRAPQDPELHLPTPEDLDIKSPLVEETVVAEVLEFTAQQRAAADSVGADLSDRVDEFATYVWWVLAAEEALGEILSSEGLDEIVGSLLAARELNHEALAAFRKFAHSVRLEYIETPPAARRAWAHAGTSIWSARRLDQIVSAVVPVAIAARKRGNPYEALKILEKAGALEMLLELREVPDSEWRFRPTPQGAAQPVSLHDVLVRWVAGEPLGQIADEELAFVANRPFRLEQAVDRISRAFGHSISWMIALIVERVNVELLAAKKIGALCESLPLYVRYGVDSELAVELIVGGIRSRDFAVAVASSAKDANIVKGTPFLAWLRGVPIIEWPLKFGARPGDVADLFDFVADSDLSLLRDLNEKSEVVLGVETELSARSVRLAETHLDAGLRAVAIYSGDELLGLVPTQHQADMLTVLGSGLQLESAIRDDGKLRIAIDRSDAA